MKKFFLYFSFLFLLTSCEKSESDIISLRNLECRPVLIVDHQSGLLLRSSISQFKLNNISISDDCLKLDFDSNICTENLEKIQLLASDLVMESLPPIVSISLSSEKSDDACTEVKNFVVSYDITKLKFEKDGAVELSLVNSEARIIYN